MSHWIIQFGILALLLAILATLAWAYFGPATIPIMTVASFAFGAMFGHSKTLEDKP